MSPPSRTGEPNGRSQQQVRTATMLRWYGGILLTAGAISLALVLGDVADASTSLTGVAWATILLSWALSSWTRRKQQRTYRATFPTLNDLRRHVNLDALRSTKQAEGEVAAVRQLRRQVPGVPLKDAVQVIRGL